MLLGLPEFAKALPIRTCTKRAVVRGKVTTVDPGALLEPSRQLEDFAHPLA